MAAAAAAAPAPALEPAREQPCCRASVACAAAAGSALKPGAQAGAAETAPGGSARIRLLPPCSFGSHAPTPTSAPRPATRPPPHHAEWGGRKVEEAEVRMPGGAGEIEYVRVKAAPGGGAQGAQGDSGWAASHPRWAEFEWAGGWAGGGWEGGACWAGIGSPREPP